MNQFEKAVLKVVSNILANVKKYYKIYRGFLRLANPYFKPIYGALDRKMTVNGREIPVRVFRPKTDGLPKVMIFYHGGGWVTGNIDTYTKICAYMAEQTKHTVVSVNYRLAPENSFPAGLEDCYYVTREIFNDPCLIDCTAEDITLIGDSAGGNLAAVVSLMARDKGEFWPSKQILIYPATYYDHSENSPFPSVREYGSSYLLTAEKIQNYMDLYIRNEEDKLNPYVAPLLADDLSNQPKTLIITAEYDPLRDEGEAYGNRLRDFQNDVCICRIEAALHGFLAFPKRSKSVIKCYESINSFLCDGSNASDLNIPANEVDK
ncbi:Acetyl esterase/lipase [Sporobacter termitidis DSM 10068]|uniref:Acetyl esterase/lipase n=1 Tax=Sporobacter termitidis DSM 10068 TaxID=1123282 RepID=A0A1M5YDB6_9FIRM|nr:alpha/beta hydrolase [Sporobacter termitidis]SHI09828.1 Acetyl esterase/lipase [Sporobacter termitidis DSM 10068]